FEGDTSTPWYHVGAWPVSSIWDADGNLVRVLEVDNYIWAIEKDPGQDDNLVPGGRWAILWDVKLDKEEWDPDNRRSVQEAAENDEIGVVFEGNSVLTGEGFTTAGFQFIVYLEFR